MKVPRFNGLQQDRFGSRQAPHVIVVHGQGVAHDRNIKASLFAHLAAQGLGGILAGLDVPADGEPLLELAVVLTSSTLLSRTRNPVAVKCLSGRAERLTPRL